MPPDHQTSSNPADDAAPARPAPDEARDAGPAPLPDPFQFALLLRQLARDAKSQ